jgi:hypothetical protein
LVSANILSSIFHDDVSTIKTSFNEVDAETNNMHRTWIQLIHELAIMEEDFNVAFNKREYI